MFNLPAYPYILLILMIANGCHATNEQYGSEKRGSVSDRVACQPIEGSYRYFGNKISSEGVLSGSVEIGSAFHGLIIDGIPDHVEIEHDKGVGAIISVRGRSLSINQSQRKVYQVIDEELVVFKWPLECINGRYAFVYKYSSGSEGMVKEGEYRYTYHKNENGALVVDVGYDGASSGFLWLFGSNPTSSSERYVFESGR